MRKGEVKELVKSKSESWTRDMNPRNAVYGDVFCVHLVSAFAVAGPYVRTCRSALYPTLRHENICNTAGRDLFCVTEESQRCSLGDRFALRFCGKNAARIFTHLRYAID